jgi:hypothetical protein
MNVEEIKNKLTEIAFEHTTPFCYSCYQDCPTGRCQDCGSDDLMRHLKGVGVEFGTDWVVENILETNLTPFDLEEAFEDHIKGCYPESIKVGWMELDTVQVMKEMDPVSWKITQDEYESELEENHEILSFDNGKTYYQIVNILVFLESL